MDASSEKQSDLLLWLAAAVVVGIGLLWLLISQPWSSGVASTEVRLALRPQDARLGDGPGAQTPASIRETNDATNAQMQLNSNLDNPLRMAQLAYEAGMLTEPEDYSAWALYSNVLKKDPRNAVALEGLDKVATDLLQRGSVALEQGRYEDAKSAATRILGAIPEHTGAKNLAARLDAMASKASAPPRPAAASAPTPEVTARAPSAPAAPVTRPEVEKAPEQPKIDPIVAAHEAFMRAMSENRLLTPADESARYYVETMIKTQADHEFTRRDRELLVTELLARSAQALEALDSDAARTWIDQAERLATDQIAVGTARLALNDRIIAMESAKVLPASTLKIVDYVAPTYPRYAATRGIEGWVDLEFTVARNGATKDIEVGDASHERYFRDEAVEAVQQWRFEPRVFMDQPIDQRTFTRLRFVLAQ
jgi:TonB family protein